MRVTARDTEVLSLSNSGSADRSECKQTPRVSVLNARDELRNLNLLKAFFYGCRNLQRRLYIVSTLNPSDAEVVMEKTYYTILVQMKRDLG